MAPIARGTSPLLARGEAFLHERLDRAHAVGPAWPEQRSELAHAREEDLERFGKRDEMRVPPVRGLVSHRETR
jgi:hypothetical protein